MSCRLLFQEGKIILPQARVFYFSTPSHHSLQIWDCSLFIMDHLCLTQDTCSGHHDTAQLYACPLALDIEIRKSSFSYIISLCKFLIPLGNIEKFRTFIRIAHFLRPTEFSILFSMVEKSKFSVQSLYLRLTYNREMTLALWKEGIILRDWPNGIFVMSTFTLNIYFHLRHFLLIRCICFLKLQ